MVPGNFCEKFQAVSIEAGRSQSNILAFLTGFCYGNPLS